MKEMVKHKNNLAQGKFEDFELRELKLFLTLISKLESQSESFLADAKFIKNYIGMERQSYIKFAEIIKRLQKRVVEIRESENFYKIYSIFSVLEFNSLEKTVNVEFNPKFLPFIYDLKDNYCKYFLENIRKLSSKYSILLYMRCQAESFKYRFTISLEEMRLLFGKKYRLDNIDLKILKPALEEINILTDLSVGLQKQYQGRALVGYTFIVQKSYKISRELEAASMKAKRNIYISKSNILNKKNLNSLLEEFTEEEIIEGLKGAYILIKKEFSSLNYLRAVIKTILSKNSNTSELNEEEIIKKEDMKLRFSENLEILKIKVIGKGRNKLNKIEWERFIKCITSKESVEEIFETCKDANINVDGI